MRMFRFLFPSCLVLLWSFTDRSVLGQDHHRLVLQHDEADETITKRNNDGSTRRRRRSLQDTSDCPDGTSLTEIDFDTVPDGSTIRAGTFVTTQWSDWGIEQISATAVGEDDDEANNRARLFDSTNPTGGDFDIGSPNENCPGCDEEGTTCNGRAKDGDAEAASTTNCVSQNNVLIIDENGEDSDPDDYAKGGSIVFQLDDSVEVVLSVGVMDIEGSSMGNQVQLLDSDSNILETQVIEGLGDNTWQEVVLEQDSDEQASLLQVTLRTSGAVASIKLCRGTSTDAERVGPFVGTLDLGDTGEEAPSEEAPSEKPTKEPSFQSEGQVNLIGGTLIVGEPPSPALTLELTSSPTPPPTSTPTSMPTLSPTVAPTATPTSPPTAKPTAAPTASPTSPPTAKPTAQATGSPTQEASSEIRTGERSGTGEIARSPLQTASSTAALPLLPIWQIAIAVALSAIF